MGSGQGVGSGEEAGPGVRSGKSGDTGGVGGEEGVGTHWQLLNFSKQLGTASQVWVVATAVNGGVAWRSRKGEAFMKKHAIAADPPPLRRAGSR